MDLSVRSLLRRYRLWSVNSPKAEEARFPEAEEAHPATADEAHNSVSQKPVDAAISAYGKPWHTAATIASLFTVSGRHIDKLYLQIELDHPDSDQIESIANAFPSVNIVVHKPLVRIRYVPATAEEIANPLYRRSIRY